jgi:CPA2 family monovalent cation:H+ antiporter-2
MAALFFVSVGMLIDPSVVAREPLGFAGALAIVLLGKPVVGYAIVRAFRVPPSQARLLAVALGQIGEFSFILTDIGFSLGILDIDARNLTLAAAVVSIAVNPLMFRWASRGPGPSPLDLPQKRSA